MYYAKTVEQLEAEIRALDSERAAKVRYLLDRKRALASEHDRAARSLERVA